MKKIVRVLLPDVLMLVGMVSIVVAMYEMWPPLAYLAGGAFALLLALILSE